MRTNSLFISYTNASFDYPEVKEKMAAKNVIMKFQIYQLVRILWYW